MHKIDQKSKRFRISLGVSVALGIGVVGLAPVQAVIASSAAAPLIRVDLTQDRSDFAALAAWATRYGHKLTFRGDVAKLAGLGRGKDVDGTGVSYQNESGLRIFFAVLPGRPEVVIAQSDSEIGMYWLVTDGALASLVYFDKRGPRKIDSSTHDAEFRFLITIFLTKMKQCSADATACPSPNDPKS